MFDHNCMKRRWKSIKRQMKILMGAKIKRNKILETKGRPILAPDLQLYCLRHTYCTDLFRAGVPISTAKELMGHSDVRMVDRVYGHFTEDQSDSALDKINDLHAQTASTAVSIKSKGENSK